MKALVYDSVFGNTENGTSDITVYTPRLRLALTLCRNVVYAGDILGL